MSEDDTSIVESVLAGHSDDFRLLVDRYHYLAERWAFRYLSNWADVETVVHDAFVEAYFRLETLREPHRFGSWLKSIVSNMAISHFRRDDSTVSLERLTNVCGEQTFFERYQLYESPTAHVSLELRELKDQLRKSIAALSSDHQRIIEMFYFDSLSYKQIADRLSISMPAVRSMLHRARQQLRKEMIGHGQETNR